MSYQCKFAMDQASEFTNKGIESMEEVGPALKKIIHYKTLRGKFSSVHPDLAAEGITKVEVGEEGLFFIKSRDTGFKSIRNMIDQDCLICTFQREKQKVCQGNQLFTMTPRRRC